MSGLQNSFFFDQILDHDPAPQIAPKPITPAADIPIPSNAAAFVARARAVACDLADELAADDVLDAMGIPSHSRTGWHRSRVMDSLLVMHGGEFQAYLSDGALRYRRLPPLMPCPGDECQQATRGGVLCFHCLKIEEEDLWNQP